MVKDYQMTIQAGLEASGPSTSAKPSNFAKEQKVKPTILNGRPSEQTGPPVVLFHPVFGDFLQDIGNQNLAISDRIYNLTEDFLWSSAEFYENEKARMKAIKNILGQIWGHIGSASYGNDALSDGVLTTDVGDQVAYRMILEGKNEIGTGGSDPTIQMALYYRGYWSQEDTQNVRDICCCPTFGVAIAGPWMCILGAVLLDKSVVQPLTPFIPLQATPPDDRPLGYIARILEALRRSFITLRNFYISLIGSTDNGEQRYFPHFRAFTDPSGTVIPFTYVHPIPEEPTRLVWKAKLVHNQGSIVVKFTQRYNVAAHTLCAANNLAPGLLYFGDGAALGGFHVVVMHYVEHQPLHPDKSRSLASRTSIYNDVLQAIILLHNNNFVFADLRNPNILIYPKSDLRHSMLIDFDWCGLDGGDVYPICLSRKIRWPDGVKSGGLLKKAHDLAWLDVLRRSLGLEKAFPDPTVPTAAPGAAL